MTKISLSIVRADILRDLTDEDKDFIEYSIDIARKYHTRQVKLCGCYTPEESEKLVEYYVLNSMGHLIESMLRDYERDCGYHAIIRREYADG